MIGKLGMLILEWKLGWGETEGCTGMLVQMHIEMLVQVNTDDDNVQVD